MCPITPLLVLPRLRCSWRKGPTTSISCIRTWILATQAITTAPAPPWVSRRPKVPTHPLGCAIAAMREGCRQVAPYVSTHILSAVAGKRWPTAAWKMAPWLALAAVLQREFPTHQFISASHQHLQCLVGGVQQCARRNVPGLPLAGAHHRCPVGVVVVYGYR